ncbi:hypothetical protein R3X28_15405 [Maribacter sp. TH_r10]|uniref:hypothetical protein n=1 Tax=Maribacter sp. TH_r10 TaxID=3082086 RepID=UPI00295549B1|nr:hypothetical protein [Maribacter sp. TH_r10]MDV7140277.1 hypothetical protein [Maribacter sp. TH_r10]
MIKLKKIIPVCLIALLTSATNFAQYGNVNGRQSNANFEANLAANNVLRGRDLLQDVLKQKNNNELSLSEIEGNPYLNENFLKGRLMYKDSIELGEYLMRYHSFADEFEISNAEGPGFLNKADYLRVNLAGDSYRPLNYIDENGEIKKGFFIIKSEGPKASLFLRKYKKVKPAQEAKTSFHKATPAKFLAYENYFLKFGNEAPFEIKLKKGKFIKLFPENQDRLKKYIKTNNLNLEEEKDAITLIDYYNSLP